MRKIHIFIKGVLVGTLLVVFFCSCGKDTAYYVDSEKVSSQIKETESQSLKPSTEEKTQESQSPPQMLYVYVCGQVNASGVYTLPEGSRVYDLFEAAGGLTKQAASEYWNQARLLTDGEMIYVPTEEEAKDLEGMEESTSQSTTDSSGKMNINTASKEELMTLPGIGEAKAEAILAYRKEHGPFSSIEELKQVEGIKEGVFSKMKDYIEIN